MFKKLGLDKEFSSAYEMLEKMMIDLGDSEVYFEKFIKYANDFYNQRGTAEGIRRIFKLFDN